MKKHKLGSSDLEVSILCLGSMTWGTQNTEAEGHAQIEYALDHGINFIDTAEIYPTTPVSKETAGDTERVIGSWIANSSRREDVVIATKIAGNGNRTARPDGGPITADNIRPALEGSLQRLRTDWIDLYQLHWPNRGSYHFRQNWKYDPSGQTTGLDQEFHDILGTLGDLVKEGKLRHFGVSNETAWGCMKWIERADKTNGPRMISIQNEYSLLHRIFDLDLAELCHHENIGLLAYSPLGAGLLTGKYEGGSVPKGSRMDINSELGGRKSAWSTPVVSKYVKVAAKHGLDPAQMALSFCASRPHMGSVIIGATTMEQLATNIASTEIVLSDDVLDDIAAIYREHPIPL